MYSHGHLLLVLLAALTIGTGCSAHLPGSGDGHDDHTYISRLNDPESMAMYHFTQARLLLAEGDHQAAAAAYEQAIRFDPDDEELRFDLAELYIAMDETVKARRTIEDILVKHPDSIEAHLALGNAYFSNKQPQQAVLHYRRVLELDPDREQVRLHLAIALVRSGELDQAVDELKGLIKKDPASMPARMALARLYREMKLGVLAEEQYRNIIAHNPDSKQAYIELGLLFEERKEWESSLALFRKVSQKNPLDMSLRHHIARILVGMKRYEEALDELELILELKPDDFDARRKIGLIFLEYERWDDAIAVFQEILTMAPDLEIARYYLGLAQERKQSWAAALDAFRQIDEDSALYDDAVSHMSYIYLETGRIDEAIELMEQRLTRPDPRPQIYYYLTALYLSIDRLERALEVVDEGTALFPENADLLYQKALVMEKSGQHTEAIAAVREVLAVDDAHADALNFLAYAYAEENRNLDEALVLAKKALDLEPEGHIYDTLGWVEFRLGNYTAAREAIEEANRKIPDDTVILEHLAEIYLKLDERQQALRIYQRILELDPEHTLAKEQIDSLAGTP